MTPLIQSTSLYFNEGKSAKEFHAAIEPRGEGYIVTFTNFRRGTTFVVSTKTRHLVSLIEASNIYQKLITSKLAKGYQYGIRGYQPANKEESHPLPLACEKP